MVADASRILYMSTSKSLRFAIQTFLILIAVFSLWAGVLPCRAGAQLAPDKAGLYEGSFTGTTNSSGTAITGRFAASLTHSGVVQGWGVDSYGVWSLSGYYSLSGEFVAAANHPGGVVYFFGYLVQNSAGDVSGNGLWDQAQGSGFWVGHRASSRNAFSGIYQGAVNGNITVTGISTTPFSYNWAGVVDTTGYFWGAIQGLAGVYFEGQIAANGSFKGTVTVLGIDVTLSGVFAPANGNSDPYASIYGVNESGQLTGAGSGATLAGTWKGSSFPVVFLVPWGARVLVQITGRSPQPDFLVAADATTITLGSGIHLNGDSVVVDQTVPLSEVQSITALLNYPTGFDGGPLDYSLNRYVRKGGSGGAAGRSPELRRYSVSSGWSYYYYTYAGSSYVQNPVNSDPPSGFTVYGIPRATGTDVATDIYNELTESSFEGTLSELGLDLPRSIPRQFLFAIAYHETKWEHYGYYNYYDPTRPSHANYYYDDTHGNPDETIVTLDGGIGILQTTNATNFLTCPQVHPTDAQFLTHLYRMASNREYEIQAGAYLLANQKWNKAHATDGASPEFLEHWYHPIQDYNGAPWYVDNTNYPKQAPGIWQIINQAQATYKTLLPPMLQNDPDLQPIPLVGSNPEFADWNFDGTLDLQLTNLTMTPATDASGTVIGVTVSVSLTPLNGFGTPTAVKVTVNPPSGQAPAPVDLEGPDGANGWTGQVLGIFAATKRHKYTLYLDITAEGATKRAVSVLTY